MARIAAHNILRAAVALVIASVVGALDPISVKGTKLYDEAGNQFFIKGVAYTSINTFVDPLLDTDQCQIDAGLMKTLGVNTIRVYDVDGSRSHDGCMQAFASQGIYVGVDLPNPIKALDRFSPQWTMELFTNWSGTVDAFAGYDNVLYFNIGNEVIFDLGEETLVAPFIKAAARDIKAFREARGYRAIPIGYSSTDDTVLRELTANYLACGDEDDTIEIYGLNTYSWCGNSTYYVAGYDRLYEQFQHLNIPVHFSETGCNPDKGHRDFSEVATMLGPVFQALFSGAVVYEWGIEENGYGLVEYPYGRHTGFPTTLDDYKALSTVFSIATPTGTAKTAYTPSNSAPACPTSDSYSWLVKPNATLPTIRGLELSTVTARTTLTSTTSTGAPADTSGTNDPSDNTEHSTQSAGGLSTGAIAGATVGSVIGALGLGARAVFCIRRRKASEYGQKGSGLEGNNSRPGFKSELPAQSVGFASPRQEMDASQMLYQPLPLSYADGRRSSADMAAQGEVQQQYYEMEGSPPSH